MTRKFIIGGISCPKCVDKITGNLLKHPDIQNTAVDLDHKVVEVEISRHIPLLELQKTISPDNKYFIRQEITENSQPLPKQNFFKSFFNFKRKGLTRQMGGMCMF